jgi:hypothetical protein
MYDILSLTNSTLLTAGLIVLPTKSLYLIHDSHFPFCRKMFILLQVQCIVLSLENLPWTNFLHSMYQISYPHSIPSVVYSKNLSKSEAPLWFSQQLYFFLQWRAVSPTPNSQAGRLGLVVCPRLLIQYCILYIAATSIAGGRSSIHNLRTGHAVVEGTHLTWLKVRTAQKIYCHLICCLYIGTWAASAYTPS